MEKLIAITGNTGKSVFSYYLTNELAQKGKKALLISTDIVCPASLLVFNKNAQKLNKSLGKVLAEPVLTEIDVMENVIMFERNKNAGILSYEVSDVKSLYPEPTKHNIQAMLDIVYSLVDYIVVDTASAKSPIDKYILNLPLTKRVCISSADLKGVAWRKEFDTHINTHILYENSRKYATAEEIKQTFTYPVKYIMPYCKEFEALYLGETIEKISPPKKYINLVKEVIGGILSEQ